MSLEPYARNELVSSEGIAYQEFLKTLTPHYTRVWLEIALGYLALGLIAAGCIYSDRYYSLSRLPFTVALAAPLIGYAVHYIMLFFHEAAHFNIARNRRRNDRLANLFIGVLLGQNIKQYRITHFLHHRYLGLPEDPERSYFEPLSWRMILESLTGIRVLKVILQRRTLLKSQTAPNQGKKPFNRQALAAVALHGGIIFGSLAFGYYALALAWAIGVGAFFPFFGSLRQLLEHRSDGAEPTVDYRQTPHGETHRIFGSGPIASTFGAAGFNRHLLHHWDMRISYTRFREMEKFLHQTPMTQALEQSRAHYFSTFSKLFSAH